MNCHECKFRKSIPGDAHSCCTHPKTGIKDGFDLFNNLSTLFNGQAVKSGLEMGITINPYGYKMGWANWPANYDQTWIETCNSFESKNV